MSKSLILDGFPVGGITVERGEDGRWWVKRLVKETITYGRHTWIVLGRYASRADADRLALEVL